MWDSIRLDAKGAGDKEQNFNRKACWFPTDRRIKQKKQIKNELVS